MNRFQLVSDNSGFLRGPTVRLSTVEMPNLPGLEYRYESCLFSSGNDSEVLARYDSLSDAIAGHAALEQKFKLKQ